MTSFPKVLRFILIIFSFYSFTIVNQSCTQPDEVYALEMNNLRVSKVVPHEILIEGTVWYGNPTDNDGIQTEFDMKFEINGLKFEHLNHEFQMTTEFGPKKKWEAPFQIRVKNEKLWDVATVTEILNQTVNKKLRIKGTSTGTFIMGGDNPVEKKVLFDFDETFNLYPEEKVPFK